MKTSNLKYVGQLTIAMMVSSSLCMVPLPAQAGEVKATEPTAAQSAQTPAVEGKDGATRVLPPKVAETKAPASVSKATVSKTSAPALKAATAKAAKSSAAPSNAVSPIKVATPAPKDATTTTSPTAPKAVEKQPLHISFNYAAEIGKGHTTPGALGQLSPAMEAMWKNLPITVIDTQGNKLEVKQELNSRCERTVGNFANGEKVTIIVDDSQIPDGYNLSWESDYTYPKSIKNYAQFQAVVDSSKPIRISLAQMKVKFDLQGGKVDGKSDSIINIVKKDNTVVFPTNPTKANLVFGGWFTELPDTESYRKSGRVGMRFYWGPQSPFSDYSRDWMSWNDATLDPLYDGIFLLRAQWNAQARFNANGGAFSDAKTEKDLSVRQNSTITLLDAPKRTDFQFLYWHDATGVAHKPGDTLALKFNTVFTAQWKQIRATVTFKNSDDAELTRVKVETGKAIDTDELKGQSMPKHPTKSGYTFKEWNTKKDGTGAVFTGASIVDQDTTVYAVYDADSSSTSPLPSLLPPTSKQNNTAVVPLAPRTIDAPVTPKPQNVPEHPKALTPSSALSTPVSLPQATVLQDASDCTCPSCTQTHAMPKTGDEFSLFALISTMALSLATFVGARKKKRASAKRSAL